MGGAFDATCYCARFAIPHLPLPFGQLFLAFLQKPLLYVGAQALMSPVWAAHGGLIVSPLRVVSTVQGHVVEPQLAVVHAFRLTPFDAAARPSPGCASIDV